MRGRWPAVLCHALVDGDGPGKLDRELQPAAAPAAGHLASEGVRGLRGQEYKDDERHHPDRVAQCAAAAKGYSTRAESRTDIGRCWPESASQHKANIMRKTRSS